jgi:hypothetical protein
MTTQTIMEAKMAKNKQYTVSDWEQLEEQKVKQAARLDAEIADLQSKIVDLLVRVEQGDKAASEALQNLGMGIIQLKGEREQISALLEVLPARKSYAKSLEVEASAAKLKELDKKFPALAARIDTAAEAYALAVKDYLDAMKGGLAFGMDLRRYQIGANEGLTFYIKKYELSGWMQHFHKGTNLNEFVNGTDKTGKCFMRRDIDTRIERMMDHARHLRGEVKGDLAYCPKCYAGLMYQDGLMVCKNGCISE